MRAAAAARTATLLRAAARRQRARPLTDLGQHVRALRQAAGLTHAALASKTRMRESQLSILEGGFNVESRQYATVARALGFRTALEMFRAAPADPRKTQLDRAWALLGDEQQARALRFLNRLVLGDD